LVLIRGKDCVATGRMERFLRSGIEPTCVVGAQGIYHKV
jgi:hypothetical protein